MRRAGPSGPAFLPRVVRCAVGRVLSRPRSCPRSRASHCDCSGRGGPPPLPVAGSPTTSRCEMHSPYVRNSLCQPPFLHLSASGRGDVAAGDRRRDAVVVGDVRRHAGDRHPTVGASAGAEGGAPAAAPLDATSGGGSLSAVGPGLSVPDAPASTLAQPLLLGIVYIASVVRLGGTVPCRPRPPNGLLA